MRGVLDRFEDGGVAVIIAEQAGREFHVPLRYLPEGSRQGMWFTLSIESGRIVDIEADLTQTKERIGKAEELMARLRSKNTGSRFKRK
ncbi:MULTISPECIES: DUF3006 domain-containing protein [unclassified Planococcus (in: firmicutes)]|uniref:DUF3006 domain-containing protein n=1 Tax=Planococcus TaxID=1372 RepID=UPI000C34A010|nr:MULTISPECIES: DUF3006 domain-containing protein [unclassified Planococcus (in: firmicutes)]AUD12786.1 DUF3006 domain-containing protein [Planococcus sp. MB-3u-03]PKG47405.1 DUF3006 domain-containing protein [Planococcus sp. Urea-trap-24]PKG88271.1 DUF3006 domain-containing protein [Planococcus sp. Urea-3u-39]PKH36804.1 DUF3006 domain-containing protein [Planococcus sp. MB-3u-09]